MNHFSLIAVTCGSLLSAGGYVWSTVVCWLLCDPLWSAGSCVVQCGVLVVMCGPLWSAGGSAFPWCVSFLPLPPVS